VRERSAQLPDALPDRVEPLVLELETLDRSLDPVPQLVQPSLELLIGLGDLLVTRADVPRLRQEVAVERVELGDPGLERAQTLGVGFVCANLGVDIPHDVVELGGLAEGAIDYLALLLQHGDL